MVITKKTLTIPLVLIGVIFAILGITIGINAFFIPFVKQAFNISTTMSYLVMTATFSGFVIFGAASGPIIKKIGYKVGIAIAFFIMAFGFFQIAPASRIASFPLLLAGLFISGLGRAMMVGSIHTYVSFLGPTENATSRIALMGISNKIFYSFGSMMLSVFMDLTEVCIEDTIIPFYIISGVMIIIGILFYFAPLPEINFTGEPEKKSAPEHFVVANSKKSIFQFPHLLLGIIAIFFAVGVENIALASINDYAMRLNLTSPENYVWIVTAGMVIGYLFGVFYIPKVMSQDLALGLSSLLGIIITLGVILVPPALSIYLIGFLGMFNSLFIAIWPLALADLGNYTKTGSSLLVIGFIGGAILPLLFGYLSDLKSHQFAYIVCLPAYIYIIYYALSGSKIRTLNN